MQIKDIVKTWLMIFEKCDRIYAKQKWNKSAKFLLAKSFIN